MTFRSLNALAAIFLWVGMMACHKDNKPTEEMTDLLVNHPWKLSAATIQPGIEFDGKVHTDLYKEMNACRKDDITTFFADGTARTEDLGIKCSPNSTNTVRWSFIGKDEVLFDNQPMHLAQLDNKTLRLEQTISTHQPDTIISLVYLRQ